MPDGSLVMVTREADLPNHAIPKGLRRAKEIGTCEFCTERVIYNRFNIGEMRAKGQKPVLICMPCYRGGVHIRQGYRGT